MTAAGDAVTVALAISLARKPDMPDAMRRACLAGALACTKRGAQPSMPTADELNRLDAQHATTANQMVQSKKSRARASLDPRLGRLRL